MVALSTPDMDYRNIRTNARMIRIPLNHQGLARLIAPLLISVLGTKQSQAQVLEGDLAYKFTVDGIHDRAEAKPLQYALLERTTVRSCDFIEECACFKLASSVPLDLATLDAMLRENSRSLSGTVEVSDGTLLTPRSHP